MSITTTGTVLTFSDGSTMTTVVFPSGTAMLFQQTSAPTGWTKVTTYNNYAVRIVSGTASTGGSVAFTTAFASQSVTGTNSGGSVSATSLSTAQLASHTHQYGGGGQVCGGSRLSYDNCATPGNRSSGVIFNAGCGSSHSHGFTQPTFSGTAINLAVNYVDHIIATKN
jgi:hypothetical protein